MFDPRDPATWHALHEHPAVGSAGRRWLDECYVHIGCESPPVMPAAVQRQIIAADLKLFRNAAESILRRFPATAVELEVLDDYTTLLAGRHDAFRLQLYTTSCVRSLNDPDRLAHDRTLWIFDPAEEFERDDGVVRLTPGADAADVLAAVLDEEPVEPAGGSRPDWW